MKTINDILDSKHCYTLESGEYMSDVVYLKEDIEEMLKEYATEVIDAIAKSALVEVEDLNAEDEEGKKFSYSGGYINECYVQVDKESILNFKKNLK